MSTVRRSGDRGPRARPPSPPSGQTSVRAPSRLGGRYPKGAAAGAVDEARSRRRRKRTSASPKSSTSWGTSAASASAAGQRERAARRRQDPERPRERHHQRRAVAAAARQRGRRGLQQVGLGLDVLVHPADDRRRQPGVACRRRRGRRRRPGPSSSRQLAERRRGSTGAGDRSARKRVHLGRHAGSTPAPTGSIRWRDRRALDERAAPCRARRSARLGLAALGPRLEGRGARRPGAAVRRRRAAPAGRHQDVLAAIERRLDRLEIEAIAQKAGREGVERLALLQRLPLDEVADAPGRARRPSPCPRSPRARASCRRLLCVRSASISAP